MEDFTKGDGLVLTALFARMLLGGTQWMILLAFGTFSCVISVYGECKFLLRLRCL